MTKRSAVLFILLGAVVLGAILMGRARPNGGIRVLPAREVRTRSEVAQANVGAAELQVAEDASFEDLFAQADLPATEKARLLDLAVQKRDSRLSQMAEDLLRRMVQSGTVADALAAIPKIPYFADGVSSLQESLCRFQGDEFGFEIIKAKFDKVLGNDPSVKPWESVCGAG